MDRAAPANSERAAMIALLLRLLDGQHEAVTIKVRTTHGRRHLATFCVEPPPPTPPPTPREDDDRSCREDVLEVLRAAGRRLTTGQVLSELERRGWTWGEATVKRHLAALVDDGTLTNDGRVRPPGYQLATIPT